MPKDLVNLVYIGRGKVFGNPYSHKNGVRVEFACATRHEAIEKYKVYFNKRYQTDILLRERVDKLIKLYKSGQEINLACYCKPKTCHGDYLKEFIISKSGELSLF